MEGKLFLIWVMILLGQLHRYKGCIVKERMALLELKEFIISISQQGQSNFVLSTWTNDTKSHCCRWEGLKCNRKNRRVINLSIGTLNLKEGSVLNLCLLHPFEEVQTLDLSKSGFSGFFDGVEGYKSLMRLRKLEILDLSLNNFNNSIFPFLNAATSLTTLFLQDNNIKGPFSANEELFVMEKLKALDLSGNGFYGSIELQGICKLKNLQELDLSQNSFVGRFPLCLTTMTGLRVLDLSSNQLTGELPSALTNLESLEYLSLFGNNFEGLFSLKWLANFSKLKVFRLDSESNSLQVKLESSWKPKFQLSVIELGTCNLEKVPEFLIYQKDLRLVDLSGNRIAGKFPSWLLENNTKLEVLRLKNNSFTSFQLLSESDHHLLWLDVSVNEFDHLFPINIGWKLPHLKYMDVANNNFHGSLPSSLGNMKDIEYLDISHNSFSGELPRSFVKSCNSIEFLRLSHNKLSGEVFPESANFSGIIELSMDNNRFTGKIGQGLRSMRYLNLLDISNNNLTGAIPSWIGEFQDLLALLISNNLLEGDIPVSLFNISFGLLDLSTNFLSGDIPPQVRSLNPVALFLHDNNLSGFIPDTLLTNVGLLDLRNNRLSGYIPEFINTQTVNVLLLRGNNLTGRIPRQLCRLSNIRLLDLANNRLSGSIPSCLSNTSLGLTNSGGSYEYNFAVGLTHGDSTSKDSFSYLGLKTSVYIPDPFRMFYTFETQYEVEFITKHRYDVYTGGVLEYFFGLDLSKNEFTGEIPLELGDLLKLRTLNLSHNYLSGGIPKTFSGIKGMENLDLSFNRLQGRIPHELTELTSLGVFNVSFNNLSGVIPLGKQFGTFDIMSYLGNPLLCGQPTNTSCNSNNFQEQDVIYDDDESTLEMVSFYWSAAATYVTILVGLFASLSFDSPWSRAWFYIVDVFIYKAKSLLWLKLHVGAADFRT